MPPLQPPPFFDKYSRLPSYTNKKNNKKNNQYNPTNIKNNKPFNVPQRSNGNSCSSTQRSSRLSQKHPMMIAETLSDLSPFPSLKYKDRNQNVNDPSVSATHLRLPNTQQQGKIPINTAKSNKFKQQLDSKKVPSASTLSSLTTSVEQNDKVMQAELSKKPTKVDRRICNQQANKIKISSLYSKDDSTVHFSKDGRCRVHGENFLLLSTAHRPRQSHHSECKFKTKWFEDENPGVDSNNASIARKRNQTYNSNDGIAADCIKVSSWKSTDDNVNLHEDNQDQVDDNASDDLDDNCPEEYDDGNGQIVDFSTLDISNKETLSIGIYWKRMVETLLLQTPINQHRHVGSKSFEWELDVRNPNCLHDYFSLNSKENSLIELDKGRDSCGIALPLISTSNRRIQKERDHDIVVIKDSTIGTADCYCLDGSDGILSLINNKDDANGNKNKESTLKVPSGTLNTITTTLPISCAIDMANAAMIFSDQIVDTILLDIDSDCSQEI
ncbi:hypothetical protein GJ496_009846 [Pomphorhynchus laevis]|nr:hypothetical protein GJ496_009846 [Pomphorhynchus laevis]